ncbi:MAG: hypothetical protein IPJ07_17865 [Acidobacteria bacterium]|nr:hypothetical protein [Acidobacteriota bacterium]
MSESGSLIKANPTAEAFGDINVPNIHSTGAAQSVAPVVPRGLRRPGQRGVRLIRG